MKAQYDIFISYRRTAYDTANLIAEKLRHAGYSVFFDIDTLTSGKFNAQLLEVICRCKDFILVLPENALERCAEENDWIRLEIICAIEHNKNIIPVMLDGFSWPSKMPSGMEELPNYQAITSAGHEYFDMAIERLKSYLKSKPSKMNKHLIVWLSSIISLVMISMGLFVYFGWRSTKVVCTEIASQLSSYMATLDLLADVNSELETSVHKFFDKALRANKENMVDLEKDLLLALDKAEKDADRYLKNFPPPHFEFSTLQGIILNFQGVERDELEGFSIYYQAMYDDFKDVISSARLYMEEKEYTTTSLNFLDAGFHSFQYSLNGLYYAYIQQLSAMPQTCRKTHLQLSGKWCHYPNGVPFGLSNEEYNNFMLQELNRAEAEINKIGSSIYYEEQMLDDMDRQLSDLERRAEALEGTN